MADTFNATLSNHTRKLVERSRQLDRIADAFYRIGNVDLADELGAIAADILDTGRELPRAYGAEVSGELAKAEERSALMLKAALFGHIGAKSNG